MKKVKGEPAEWEKIFANLISDKEFVFSICNELLQLINKETNNPVLKIYKGSD